MTKKWIYLIACVALIVVSIIVAGIMGAFPSSEATATTDGDKIESIADLGKVMKMMESKKMSIVMGYGNASDKYRSATVKEVTKSHAGKDGSFQQSAEYYFGEDNALFHINGTITAGDVTKLEGAVLGSYEYELYFEKNDVFIKFVIYNCGYSFDLIAEKKRTDAENEKIEKIKQKYEEESRCIKNNLNKWICLTDEKDASDQDVSSLQAILQASIFGGESSTESLASQMLVSSTAPFDYFSAYYKSIRSMGNDENIGKNGFYYDEDESYGILYDLSNANTPKIRMVTSVDEIGVYDRMAVYNINNTIVGEATKKESSSTLKEVFGDMTKEK